MKKDKPLENSSPGIRWLFLMAWRDSRRNRGRLLLFVSSIILGIAALVATLSFGEDLRNGIDDQAKVLVGADLVIRSNRPLTPAELAIPDTVPNRHAREDNFASMIYFVRSGESRLVQVRALDGEYPFYGSLETTPTEAGHSFRNERQALVDKGLLLQYGAQVGDSIRIGSLNFAIAGILNKAPGSTELSMTVAPPVYIPLRYLSQAGLQQRGSRIQYQYYYQYPSPTDIGRFMDSLTSRLGKAHLRYETIESRKTRMSRAFGDFTEFLTLISFIALLMGCIGVGSAVHIYIREKIDGIAVLRCLGVKVRQAFLIYLIQIACIGLLGSVAGVSLGLVIQRILPVVFRDLLPLEAATHLSPRSIGQGMITGLTISILFALLPLLSIRSISPLYTLRRSFEPPRRNRDPLKGVVYTTIFLFVAIFSFWQMHAWTKAFIFCGSLFAAFLLLAGVARLLMWSVRHFFPASWNYLWRQGFANLYRPNNQTLILIVTIGLGTTFIGTLYFVQQMLVDRIAISSGKNQGNMVLFDVQNSELKGVVGLAIHNGVTILQDAPLVSMRLTQIRRRLPDRAREDSVDHHDRRWVFDEEARATYRDTLTGTEKILSGKLGTPVRSPQDIIYVSLEEEYARAMIHAGLGDTLLFNVQGLPLTTVIGSIRTVNSRRLETNFHIVFPGGVLEQAPQFHILIARVPSVEVSARFQKAVVQQFSGVSVIDLGLVLSILDEVLDKIGFVIRFMAGFSMLTGLIVLIASVLISKFQRIQETVLLRTLGARRRQILIIATLEYFFLGALAAGTGILLSLATSWFLARYSFESSFSPHAAPIALLFASICLLTITIGLLNSRSVLNRPPLEILRKEV
ncbi:MAG: ABC transporter permease [Puia sp.]|nr:ABC transporter permease [Puia sp.]